MIKWRYRTYRLWVINTQTACDLYLWDKWKLLMPSLDALIKLTTAQAFMRTFQSYEFENRWLGFGRMKWSQENNIKWTTKYWNGNAEDKIILFFNTEIWAPDWNWVCDNDMPPDLFIRLYNYPTLKNIKEGLIVAMPKSLYNKNKVLVDDELRKLVNQIPDSTISTSTQSWWPGWRTWNEIGDINNQEIEKIVKRKSR